MNYRRGIVRLYCVFVGIWMAGTFIRRWDVHREGGELIEKAEKEMHDCYVEKASEERGFPWRDPNDLCGTNYRRNSDAAYAVLRESAIEIFKARYAVTISSCLMLPAIVGVLLLSLLWVVRGIRSA